MLESLSWQKLLNSPYAEQHFRELQTEALRLFLILAIAGYVLWHNVSTFLTRPLDHGLPKTRLPDGPS